MWRCGWIGLVLMVSTGVCRADARGFDIFDGFQGDMAKLRSLLRDGESMQQQSPASAKDLEIAEGKFQTGLQLSMLASYHPPVKAANAKLSKLYHQVDDSLSKKFNTRQLHELQLRYELDSKEKAISTQRIELQKAGLYKNLVLAAGLLMCLLACVTYRACCIKRCGNRILQQKQKEIHDQLRSLVVEKDELLTEKDWLLRELHHRVKNNLQIIMSLLNTQTAFLKNAEALEAIGQSRDRIQAIAMIHQKLYNCRGGATIRTAAYVDDLIAYLSDTYDTGRRKIQFVKAVENIELELNQAVPLALILNEAISNAIRFAFPSAGGDVRIRFSANPEGLALLTVADNGPGLPADFDLQHSETLGMEIMKALSRQLGGDLTAHSQNGVIITLRFRIEKIIQSLPLGELLHTTRSA